MSPLELRHLETLIAFAETGSMTRAADRLNLSQSALSHQVKILEDYYENALFLRKTTPPQWTRTGERLLGLAYDIVRQVNDAERDLSKIREGVSGQLRIAVECHSCFDWLMPSMDLFRKSWPEIELDLLSGFHADPGGLLDEGRADLVIISSCVRRKKTHYIPMFRFAMPALLANDHRLLSKDYLTARDFEMETLITYPIPRERMDIFKKVLNPGKVLPRQQRKTELTVAILQLVASKRGIAVLPRWAVKEFLDRDYISERQITSNGLMGDLYAAVASDKSNSAYLQDFVSMMKSTMTRMFDDVELL